MIRVHQSVARGLRNATIRRTAIGALGFVLLAGIGGLAAVITSQGGQADASQQTVTQKSDDTAGLGGDGGFIKGKDHPEAAEEQPVTPAPAVQGAATANVQAAIQQPVVQLDSLMSAHRAQFLAALAAIEAYAAAVAGSDNEADAKRSAAADAVHAAQIDGAQYAANVRTAIDAAASEVASAHAAVFVVQQADSTDTSDAVTTIAAARSAIEAIP